MLQMSNREISIRKLNGIVMKPGCDGDYKSETTSYVATINAEMIRLGYIMSADLFVMMSTYEPSNLTAFSIDIIDALKNIKGDDVEYIPMYPNFPKQVMEASDLELFMNALIHYWSLGTWKPEYIKEARQFALEGVKLREIGVIAQEEFHEIFTNILSSNDSISDLDKHIVETFLTTPWMMLDSDIPDIIPYKENMCIVASFMIQQGKDISKVVKTTTDVLRMVTYLSGGDVSLATNTKFKSLPRRYRKQIIQLLNEVISEEDIKRHKNKWVRLFHSLHVMEYSKPATELSRIVQKLRNNNHLISTAGTVQALINAGTITAASKLLMSRPGDFARKLDFLLRQPELKNHERLEIVDNFSKIVNKISTRVLMQLIGHFRGRVENPFVKRIIFPKGNIQKARILEPIAEAIPENIIIALISMIEIVLVERFKDLGDLGDVYLDDSLKDCPLPTQQRTATEGIDVYARGTKIPMTNDKSTIRLFIYWIGQDIDLSATFHDENFVQKDNVSYTHLRTGGFSVHSGDVVEASNGASEFIDVNIEKALAAGHRYLVMNVYVYSGPDFSKHKKVYAGWMMRNKPKSNEIFEPATVENKMDLTMDSRNAIPVVFDLKERKVIVTDLATKMRTHIWGNNVHSNMASTQNVLESIMSLHNKTTLYNLFSLHIQARGNHVSDKEEADIVFALDGNIGPKDINIINNEYLK